MTNNDILIGRNIRQFRTAKQMSQKDLAKLWGLSREAVSQVETGSRKVGAGEIAKLSSILGVSADILLGLIKEPNVILEIGKKIKSMDTNEIRISVPQKNIEKFREVLLYILSEVSSKPNVGETVLYKLLYFSDFDYYEKYEEQLTGSTYMKNIFGPTPLEFRDIVKAMIEEGVIEKVPSNYYGHDQTRYLANRPANLVKIKASELQLIDQVLAKLSDMNATQISEYSHNDIPWLATEENGIIDYESVFYRTALYSVREYPEEND
jgi:transcriptional regulator with XRE-family HTH domain